MKTKEIVKTWKWRICKSGTNQLKFSEKLGIKPSQLSYWINGKRNPSLDDFDKVEEFLKELEK